MESRFNMQTLITWVVMVIFPADWWNAWSSANRPAYGLDGALLACMKRPKLRSSAAKSAAVSAGHGHVVMATRTCSGGLGSPLK